MLSGDYNMFAVVKKQGSARLALIQIKAINMFTVSLKLCI